ncbi:MAG: hypothetical protein M1569_00815 [Candidatus Marsarchaeota archaeon]|nr:hypothetical protein [Candidatus Marsarchaeota archaeon]MCL5412929.1 hypothetical protein [Candidatus Marsarchaeota archaeon]
MAMKQMGPVETEKVTEVLVSEKLSRPNLKEMQKAIPEGCRVATVEEVEA